MPTIGKVTTPAGGVIDVIRPGSGAVLVGGDGNGVTVVVNGEGVSEALLGGIWDAAIEMLREAKKLISCTPKMSTTVNFGHDGKIASITTTTTCEPG